MAVPIFAAFEEHGAGARAPGMGNVFTAVADDLYAVYYNPAGLADLDRPQVSVSYSRLAAGLSDSSNLGLSNLTFAHPLKSGEWGTLGGAWQRFALDQLYSEQSTALSYGAQAYSRQDLGKVLWGLNLKYLGRSFDRPPEAFNAFGPDLLNQGQDPVLMGRSGRSALDADLGFLYRTPVHYSLGARVLHLLQPDVGFGGADVLPLAYRVGAAYKSLWLNVASEAQFDKQADGAMGQRILLAAERYFPSLDYGHFGVRGSLGIGSRDFKQLTVGFAYRVNKFQMDYAFLMPLGTIKSTVGSHRLALTFHLGAPRAEDEYSLDLFNSLMLAERKPGVYAYEFEGLKAVMEKQQTLGAMIKKNLQTGYYQKSLKYLDDLVEISDAPLAELKSRVRIVSEVMPQLVYPKLKWEIMTAQGIAAFLTRKDELAVKKLSYAASLHPQSAEIETLLAAMEGATGRKGERLTKPWREKLSLVEEKLLRTESLLREGQADEVIRLCEEVVALEPDNAVALSRLGTAYYIKRDAVKAIWAWEKAVEREENPEERKKLYRAIRRAQGEVGTAGLSKAAGGIEEKPRSRLEKAAVSPRTLEALYSRGVEHYSRKEYDLAEAAFLRLLELDPEDQRAQRSLERIRREAR